MYCDPFECHSQNIQLGSESLYLFLEAFYSFALVRWWKMNKTQSVTVIQITRGEKKNQSIKNWCQIITEELNENKKIFLFDSLPTACTQAVPNQSKAKRCVNSGKSQG